MIYRMRQKVFCFGDDYQITDEQGTPCFIVDGAAFSLRQRTSFRDMQGNELCQITRRLLSFGPTYEIARDGHTTIVHKQLFTFFKCRFSIDVPGPDDLEASGSFLDMEYQFTNTAGGVVAAVSKRWFAISDSYGVEIANGHDDVLILAATVVVDLCCHADNK